MLPWLILALALSAGIYFLARWFLQADPRVIARTLRWGAIIAGASLAVYFVWASRWSWLPASLPFLLPWLARWRHRARQSRNAAGPSAGGQSAVETRFLRMALDHATGGMTGHVLAGTYQGWSLESLDLTELLDLFGEVRGDAQSAAVLGAWLDQAHPGWREAAGAAGPGAAGEGAHTAQDTAGAGPRGSRSRCGAKGAAAAMRQADALNILGLEAGASREDIDQAYRRLMLKLHPDQGGSDWLASRINEARAVLLGA